MPNPTNAVRRGYRNGSKPRQLNTRVGTLTLQVPQDRGGTFSTQLFARYQRNEKALVLALMEMYVEGVSTRKVREITEVLCGTSFSKSLVSELVGQLDAELAAWRHQPLTETTYPYLSVDARYEHVRQGGRMPRPVMDTGAMGRSRWLARCSSRQIYGLRPIMRSAMVLCMYTRAQCRRGAISHYRCMLWIGRTI